MGYDYPVGYMLLADAGLVACVVAAVVERAVIGPTGTQWAVLALAVALATTPLLLSLMQDHSRLWMHCFMAFEIAAVAVFWTVPARLDLAPLLLVMCATMIASIASPKLLVVDAAAATVAIVVGAAFGRVQQELLLVLMLWFGGLVGALLRMQLQLLHREREARDAEAALDRAAIAREVHDVVAHSLSIVLLNVTGARRALQSPDGEVSREDVDDAVAALEDAERQGRAAMSDVRRTISLLRTDGPAPDAAQPGFADVPELIESFRRAGTSVRVRLESPGVAATAAAELAVYRIVQESLSNATRHAPGAAVDIDIRATADGVRVIVANPAPAARHGSAGGGLGVAGMRSRAEHLGGALTAGVVRGRWIVDADLPLAGESGPSTTDSDVAAAAPGVRGLDG